MVISVDMPEAIVAQLDSLIVKKLKAEYIKKVGPERAQREYLESLKNGCSNRSQALRKVIQAGLEALSGKSK